MLRYACGYIGRIADVVDFLGSNRIVNPARWIEAGFPFQHIGDLLLCEFVRKFRIFLLKEFPNFVLSLWWE